jgi:hypothetical protein
MIAVARRRDPEPVPHQELLQQAPDAFVVIDDQKVDIRFACHQSAIYPVSFID